MWRQGVLLQLANPKAILFFTALLPQFVDPAHSVAPQIGVLAATSIVSEFVVLAGYAWLAARGPRDGRFAIEKAPESGLRRALTRGPVA